MGNPAEKAVGRLRVLIVILDSGGAREIFPGRTEKKAAVPLKEQQPIPPP
jgi:hypothetical protein